MRALESRNRVRRGRAAKPRASPRIQAGVRTLAILAAVAVVVAQPTPAVAAADPVPPTRTRPLLAWLRAGGYRSEGWVPEPTVRPSRSAHGANVRTWLNPVLVEDLRAGRPAFRRGAAMVKELYLDGQRQVRGFSVMRKVGVRSGRRGKGWYFFETFDSRTPVVRPGRGTAVCVGCHRAGQDYYLLGFRP